MKIRQKLKSYGKSDGYWRPTSHMMSAAISTATPNSAGIKSTITAQPC
jgi:hypothetical protein